MAQAVRAFGTNIIGKAVIPALRMAVVFTNFLLEIFFISPPSAKYRFTNYSPLKMEEKKDRDKNYTSLVLI
jgi:hypothetical protein